MNAIEAGRQPRVGRLWAGKAEPSLEIRLSKLLVHPAANTLLVVFSIVPALGAFVWPRQSARYSTFPDL
jgi:hypothetical protein